MPDLVLVPAEVLPGAGAAYTNGVAGAAVTAGQVCYLDAASKSFKLADANASAATATARGIALHAADVGQPLTLQSGGDITLGAGAAMVVGGLYVLSSTPGGIAPVVELIAAMHTTLLGVALTATSLRLQVLNSGVVHA
jgi:hypothetical protein